MKKQDSFLYQVFRSKVAIACLVVAVVFSIIAISALRNNYTTMVELRSAVVVADEKNGDIEKALQDLRKHVHGHMNTNLASGANAIKPPIQLKARYERLMTVERERVKKENAEIAKQAEAVCSARFPATGINSPRVSCITEYVSANAVKEMPVAEDLYKFDFVSPRWSPDLAGFSLLIATIAGLSFVICVVLIILKRRFL